MLKIFKKQSKISKLLPQKCGKSAYWFASFIVILYTKYEEILDYDKNDTKIHES